MQTTRASPFGRHETRALLRSWPSDADDPGVRVEVIEGTGMRDMIAHGIAEARAWDGTDPVRIIDAAAASA